MGDNQCLLQSLKDSPYYKSFEDKAGVWETKLADLDEYLHNLNQIQRKWVYLEPIFGRGALPKEHSRFKRVDDEFRAILGDISRDTRVLSLSNQAGLRTKLATMLEQLQRCQKALNKFLEEKRSIFPRFYFIGDDDLLEILGQSTNPNVIQAHLKKLFQVGNVDTFAMETSKKVLRSSSASLKVSVTIGKVSVTTYLGFNARLSIGSILIYRSSNLMLMLFITISNSLSFCFFLLFLSSISYFNKNRS